MCFILLDGEAIFSETTENVDISYKTYRDIHFIKRIETIETVDFRRKKKVVFFDRFIGIIQPLLETE